MRKWLTRRIQGAGSAGRRTIVLCGLLASGFTLAFPAGIAYGAAPEAEIKLVVNGEEIRPDIPPQLVKSRTLVPVRWVSEALGAKVDWDEGKQAVLINSAPEQAAAKGPQIQLIVDGKALQPDVPPQLIDGRLLVPVRWVSEALGTHVDFDFWKKTVIIQSIHWANAWQVAGEAIRKSGDDKPAPAQADKRGIFFHSPFEPEWDDAYGARLLENTIRQGDVSVVRTGNGVLSVNADAQAGAAFIREFEPQSGKITAEVKFMQPKRGNVTILQLLDRTKEAVTIAVERDKMIYRTSESDSLTVLEQTAVDTWYTVKVVADPTAHRADVYLNERPVLLDVPLYQKVETVSAAASSAIGASYFLDEMLIGKGRIDVPSGYASVGALTTGGLGGRTVTVGSREELLQYIGLPEPYTIYINGTIDLSAGPMHQVASDKSVIGLKYAVVTGGGFRMAGVENVVIRNITFNDSLDDAIEIRDGSRNIWIDHNTFGQQHDGGVDTRLKSSYVTVSWNRFKDTGKAALVGSSDNDTGDKGHLKMTFHHNLFENTTSRNPMVRFGDVHVFNNHYLGVRNYAVRSYTEGSVFAEYNYFQNTKTPFEVVGGLLFEQGNVFDQSGLRDDKEAGFGLRSDPGEYYRYSKDAAADIPALIAEGAGAGKIRID